MRLSLISAMFSSSNSQVLTTKVGSALNIKLNRPSQLNALNLSMIAELNQILDQTNQTSCIILSGEGGKAFCAGGDIKTLYFAKTQPSEQNPPSALKQFFFDEYKLDYRLATLKPVLVALMDGIVMGGGVGMSIHAPVRIATEKSVFAMPEAKLGLFTDVGGGYFLSRLPHRLGYYLGLSGFRLKGADLVHAGLADFYVQSSELQNLISKIGTIQSQNLNEVKNIVKQFQPNQIPEFTIKQQLQNIEPGYSGESLEQIFNNLQNHQNQKFGQDNLKILKDQCPLSLRIIFEQIKRGQKLDLRENLKMDYRIVRRIMQGTDFFEGVKQVLVDKNHVPNWSFKDALTIPQSEVDKYFKVLENEEELDI
ncbi:unnamed protein product [Paramecium pentaurelia]|uniref:3-hydroxyisobutyryl-CoA hydrolase n=1 Tax=Paramecium pentaurelia TaxID=43138 RepID=A0A8S1WJD8_9CILI|nr:unnamed protein product [Paramecium pentaurelia]